MKFNLNKSTQLRVAGEIPDCLCSDSAIPNSLAVGLTLYFSDMVRVVDCQAGVHGSNPGGPKIFSPWNLLHWWQR